MGWREKCYWIKLNWIPRRTFTSSYLGKATEAAGSVCVSVFVLVFPCCDAMGIIYQFCQGGCGYLPTSPLFQLPNYVWIFFHAAQKACRSGILFIFIPQHWTFSLHSAGFRQYRQGSNKVGDIVILIDITPACIVWNWWFLFLHINPFVASGADWWLPALMPQVPIGNM